MAENKNTETVIETVEEIKDAATPEATEASEPEKPVDEKKETITVPKWLVRTARVIEGLAAAFGAIVGGLLIKDKLTKAKRRKHYIQAPAHPEIPRHYMDDEVRELSDVKVDTF